MRLLDLMPNLAPMTPTLSHSASKTRANALMLRSRLWHASRCAREREPTEFAAPLFLIAIKLYSIRTECAGNHNSWAVSATSHAKRVKDARETR